MVDATGLVDTGVSGSSSTTGAGAKPLGNRSLRKIRSPWQVALAVSS
jgi:hypothetical protein